MPRESVVRYPCYPYERRTPISIDFTAPPPPKSGRLRGRTPLGLWLAELQAHPGRWARWTERVTSSDATSINKGRRSGIVAGTYQAAVRNVDAKHRGDLYVRYLGPVDATVVVSDDDNAVITAASTVAVLDAAGIWAIEVAYLDDIPFSTPIACEVRWTTEDAIIVTLDGREVTVEAQELREK